MIKNNKSSLTKRITSIIVTTATAGIVTAAAIAATLDQANGATLEKKLSQNPNSIELCEKLNESAKKSLYDIIERPMYVHKDEDGVTILSYVAERGDKIYVLTGATVNNNKLNGEITTINEKKNVRLRIFSKKSAKTPENAEEVKHFIKYGQSYGFKIEDYTKCPKITIFGQTNIKMEVVDVMIDELREAFNNSGSNYNTPFPKSRAPNEQHKTPAPNNKYHGPRKFVENIIHRPIYLS